MVKDHNLKMKDNKFCNMPFDKYQRFDICRKVLSCIHNNFPDRSGFILDLGGRDGSLFESIGSKADVLVADKEVITDNSEVLYLRTDAKNLPFRNKTLDISVSLDTLEHIEQCERKSFADELQRITTSFIICSFPHNTPENLYIEKLFSKIIMTVQKKEDLFLAQHINNELPDISDIEEYKHEDIRTFISFGASNVYLWFLLSILKRLFSFYGYEQFFTDISQEIDILYNRYLSHHDNIPPFYRAFVIMSFIDLDESQKAQLKNININPDQNEIEEGLILPKEELSFFAVNYAISAIKADADHINKLYLLMKDYEVHFKGFHDIIREKDCILKDLQKSMRDKDHAIGFLREENHELQAEMIRMNSFLYFLKRYLKNKFASFISVFKKENKNNKDII